MVQSIDHQEGAGEADGPATGSPSRLEALLDAARIGILQFDTEGRAVYVNRRWRQLTGIDKALPIEPEDLLRITHPDDRDDQIKRWLAMSDEDRRYSATVRMLRPEGGYRWVDIEFDPLASDVTDSPTGYVASFADVTDRVEAESAARASEQRTAAVLESLHEGLVIHDADGKILTSNAAATRITGIPPQLHDSSEPWRDWKWFDEDGEPLSFDEFPTSRALRSGDPQSDVVVGFELPTGERHWLQMNARRLPAESDHPEPLIVVSFRDVTTRKQALDALRESEERYRNLLEQAPIGHVVTDMRGHVVQANQVFADLVGVEQADLIDSTPADLIHPDDLERALVQLAVLQASETDRIETELRLLRSDGHEVWVGVTAAVVRSPDGEPRFLHVTVSDVTERLLAQKRVHDSEQRYRAMVDSLHDGILIHSLTGLEAANESAARILGVELDELLAHPEIYTELEPHDLEGKPIRVQDRPAVITWGEGRSVSDFIEQVTLPSGTKKWLSVNTRPLFGEDATTPTSIIMSFSDITESKEAEDRLRESEERYRQLSANSPLGQLVADLDGVVIEANQALGEILGIPADQMVGKEPWDLVHTEDREALLELGGDLVAGKTDQFTFEARLRRFDTGEEIWAVTNNALLRDAHGEPKYFLSLSQDVTERRRAEEELRRLASIVESTSDLVSMIDYESGRLLYLNQAARHVLGYVDDDVTRVHSRRLYATDVTRLFRGAIETALRNGDSWSGEVDMRRADGSVIKVWQTLSGDVDPDGRIRTISSVGRDVTERRQHEVNLAHRATHDPLTDLPNRTLLLDHLELALARSRRKGNHVALLFLDLDRFKSVNDNLGHEAGDLLLIAVAERIQVVLRPTDTIARLGGDEFVILCEDVEDENHAVAITQRVTATIANEPFFISGTRLDVTVSVGIAVDSDPDAHPEALLRDADAAMYRAKDRGRSRHELFDEAMRRRSATRLRLADELGEALETGEIEVHYQPLINLRTGKVTGVEALARWRHPRRGLLPPYEFIGLAEETGLIVGLGLEVLSLAADQARRWEIELGVAAPQVHVNLSARQLTHSSLPSVVDGVLEQSLIEPNHLCLEITESVLMDDAPKAIAALAALKDIGVDLAIDDFGTGYSSLAYLRRFPVDMIKVDRSFVDGLGPDPHDSTIVAAIVSLAHTLGLSCVAEGVETEEQLAGLRALGCEAAQGYLFAYPGPVTDMGRHLDTTFDVTGNGGQHPVAAPPERS